jgi:regulator of protease activity HflC (stomatin/prohibitin superfamily)
MQIHSSARQSALLWGVGIVGVLIALGVLYSDTLLALWEPFLLAGQDPLAGLPLTPRFWHALVSIGFALAAPGVTYLGFHWLVSQFVLPVDTPEERRRVSEHFPASATGPAIFVRNGQLIANVTEKAHANVAAGVILVDSVSAVVLRTDTRFTGAYGPGVIFTRRGEYIETTLDLRQQERWARGVKAFTRDGIQVGVDVRVTFILDSGERNPVRSGLSANAPPFGFNPESAYKAVYGRAYRDRVSSEWAELPALMASDIWRELLVQRDFESLFRSDDQAFALLDDVQGQIENRLTGWSTEGPQREFNLLTDRGLRVLSVRLVNLDLPKDVVKKRVAQLKEIWSAQAKQAASDIHPIIKLTRDEGRQSGQALILRTLTALLGRKLAAGDEPNHLEVAAELTAKARELLVSLGPAEQQVDDIRKALVDMEIRIQGMADEFRRPPL